MKKTVRVSFDTDCKYHQLISYHTAQQAKMFFASGKDLGIETVELKDRAKKKFEKDCFNKLTKSEMKWLIDSLNQKIYDKDRKKSERVGASQTGAKS